MPIIVLLAIVVLVFFYEPDKSVTENATAVTETVSHAVTASPESKAQLADTLNGPVKQELTSFGEAVQDVTVKAKTRLESLGEQVTDKYPVLRKGD